MDSQPLPKESELSASSEATTLGMEVKDNNIYGVGPCFVLLNHI